MGGNVIPVSITGEMSCTLGFVTSAGGTCQPPACTDSFYDLGSGTYVLDCEAVLIHEATGKQQFYIVECINNFFMQGGSVNSEIYVCNPSADAFFKTGGSGTMDVYIFALGTTNERHVSWASGSSNKGSITTSTGGTFAWGGSHFSDTLSYSSDISFLHWSDLMVCADDRFRINLAGWVQTHKRMNLVGSVDMVLVNSRISAKFHLNLQSCRNLNRPRWCTIHI